MKNFMKRLFTIMVCAGLCSGMQQVVAKPPISSSIAELMSHFEQQTSAQAPSSQPQQQEETQPQKSEPLSSHPAAVLVKQSMEQLTQYHQDLATNKLTEQDLSFEAWQSQKQDGISDPAGLVALQKRLQQKVNDKNQTLEKPSAQQPSYRQKLTLFQQKIDQWAKETDETLIDHAQELLELQLKLPKQAPALIVEEKDITKLITDIDKLIERIRKKIENEIKIFEQLPTQELMTHKSNLQKYLSILQNYLVQINKDKENNMTLSENVSQLIISITKLLAQIVIYEIQNFILPTDSTQKQIARSTLETLETECVDYSKKVQDKKLQQQLEGLVVTVKNLIGKCDGRMELCLVED